MSSTIHKFLFSPPPSPPLEGAVPAHSPFTPLRSLLPAGLAGMEPPPSPKLSRSSTPIGNRRAGADVDYMSLLPPINIEAANQPSVREKVALFSPPLLSPRLVRNRIPRPLLRLMAFITIVVSGVMLIRCFTEAVAPVPRPQDHPIMSNYRPAFVPAAVGANRQMPLVAPNPRAFRPASHPLPDSHELLALQSFVMETAYNHLSSSVDASKPLDAHDLLGPAARKLGGSGSEREKEWFAEVSAENANNVVVWHSSASVPHYVLEGINSRHGQGHRATLVSLASRSDGDLIGAIMKRLGFDVDAAPLLVIGGQPTVATEEVMDELRSSGQLNEKLSAIGWRLRR